MSASKLHDLQTRKQQLEAELDIVDAQIWQEKVALEERMRADLERLRRLGDVDTPEKKAQKDKKDEAARKAELEKAQERAREDARSRPAHWPYPYPNMSSEEIARWHDAHDI